MSTTLDTSTSSRPCSPTISEKRRAGFARGLAFDAHRRSSWDLDDPDFEDRRPDQAPRQLGNIAAEVVGDVGEAAKAFLDHMPSTADLMPKLEFQQVHALLDGKSGSLP